MDFEDIKLREKITNLVRALRKNGLSENICLTRVQSVRHDEVLFFDRLVKRKRIVLLSPGCTIGTCTMCPLPDEAIGKKCKITIADLKQQVDQAFNFNSNSDYELVTVYTNSNFFLDDDIFPETREYIYNKFNLSPASVLVVESLPQFITEEKLTIAKGIIGNKKIAVAMGLQSSNDIIRELAINSTTTRSAFEKAVELLNKYGYLSQTFLMIKPPFLLESEAIEDTLASIKYLYNLGIIDPILCTTRVAPNTLLELLYKQGRFIPPWLYTVIEIMKRSQKEIPHSYPRVVVAELRIEQNSDSICASNCAKCSSLFIDKIEEFNVNRDPVVFDEIKCSCFHEYEQFVNNELPDWRDLSISERVADFLKNNSEVLD